MAKPAKFDRKEVIEKATKLFWERGFHATSMRTLQETIDMRPGSIYASFGSKEGLFKETLDCYAKTALTQLKSCIKAAPSPLSGFKSFIKDIVIFEPSAAPSSMCMLVKTVSELTEKNADLLEEAKGLLLATEETFAEIFDQAKAQGELDPETDTRRLARQVQVQLIGLRSYARINDDPNKISELIDRIFH